MPVVNPSPGLKLRIGSFECGGQQGENPPLVLGTIFYEGQTLVSDHRMGLFDQEKALAQVKLAEEASQRFHIPVAFDLTALTPVALSRYVDFIAANSHLPFVLDSADLESRLAGLRYCHERNVLDRAIYNSITRDYASEEVEALAQYPPAAVIVLAIDEEDYSPSGTIRLLKELLPALRDSSVTNAMVDVGVLDQVSLKLATEIARAVKGEFGLPVGGAPCNGIYMWTRLRELPLQLFESALATSVAFATASGFDFAFGGPLKTIEKTALSVAVASVYDRYYLRQHATGLTEEHPISHLL